MKTITYNPETHVLVPISLANDAREMFIGETTARIALDIIEWFTASIAAAPQPEPVAFIHTCKSGETLSWFGESSNAASRPDFIKSTPLYPAPPDRTAELEAALKVARDALIEYSNGASGAIAKINEVLK